ncbi:hypothetical protein AB6A40_000764 [Gnathostoma spinigerum]|uniref:Uncharacterized protein n=1 Tax=Gnathostoma spinigerum TaxID=75299 RepID=A0ABD6ECM1_9BILA
MESGTIVGVGSHTELKESCPQYADFCHQAYSQEHANVTKEDQPLGEESFEQIGESGQTGKRHRTVSSLSGSSQPASLLEIPLSVEGQLVDEEENAGLAVVPFSVYKIYVNAAGGVFMWTIVLLSFFAAVGSNIFATYWLSFWLKRNRNIPIEVEMTNGTSTLIVDSFVQNGYSSFYATVYGLTILFLFFSGLLRAMLFVKSSLTASSRLHNRMLRSMMRGTIAFFDSTPSGRILNRFSRDIDEIDIKLPFTFEVFLHNTLTSVGFVLIIAWVFPIFLLACIPIFGIFIVFVLAFRAGIRSLKRAENISRSPLFDWISASMEGLVTIHSFGQTNRFIEALKVKLDHNSGAMFMYHSAMRWLAIWLDILVVLTTFIVSLCIVILTGYVAPSDAGMALAFAIQMSGIVQFAVRTQTELEAMMTSVERVNYYATHIESEDDWEQKKDDPPLPPDWPQSGAIEFKEVKLRYRPDLELSLDDVTFSIEPADKVGIIGRTGSGKSSLCQVLLRVHPLTWGTIEIDGVDITRVGLHRLRKSVAIIPQDPTLFAGTLRFNLDPTAEFNDDQLWTALEKTFMRDKVASLENCLDFVVTEGGRNFSTGEKQLLCLARATLRNSRIILLDEATGSLDGGTDKLIQKCLEETFASSTVLLIAHRMENVMNMQKVLILDQGKVVEFGEIKNILNDKKSRLYLASGAKADSLVDETKYASDAVDDAGASQSTTGSTPVHLYPNLDQMVSEVSDAPSVETSEFEKISDPDIGKGTSPESSDIEILERPPTAHTDCHDPSQSEKGSGSQEKP